MARSRRDQDLRVGGMDLRTKFTLSMALSLTVVMALAGFVLVQSVTSVARDATDQRLAEAVQLTAELGRDGNYRQEGDKGISVGDTGVVRVPVVYNEGSKTIQAEVFQASVEDGMPVQLLVPADSGKTGRKLLGLIIGIIALVIGVGAVVSVVVANQVAAPLEGLVDNVRQISHGNMTYRSHVEGVREVVLLGRAIDRMASSLKEAQDAELELVAREREMEVAGEVREALLPEGTPQLADYEVGGLQIGCPEPGGDFYDFVEKPDGKLGLLLCEVSGKGVPGALVAATARSYLRAVLSSAGDVKQALGQVNRFFAPDVRRGMYVTSMYVELDPHAHTAEIACAGHKVPLLRFTAADGKLRTLQPEGIALGFDKGPIFERTLESVCIELEVGDRLLLSNVGPFGVHGPDGEEFGEQGFFRGVLKRAEFPTDELLEALELAFETFADGEDYPSDISILTLRRSS